MILLPVLPSATCRAWPKHAEGARARYYPLPDALGRRYPFDAHTAAYSMPSVERRLCLAATERRPVELVVAIFDIDASENHAPADDAWWVIFRARVLELRRAHPGAVGYRTRGGARLLYALPFPFVVEGPEDSELWRVQYLGWLGYLANRFSIHADPACSDWTRLFRLPHATREHSTRPEELDTIGNPGAIGPWAPTLSDADIAVARKLRPPRAERPTQHATPSTYHGEGLLWHALHARGHIGAQLGRNSWACICPNGSQHTKGSKLDSSTALFAPNPGEEIGHIHCKHGHCVHLRTKDWLQFFTVAELDAARAAAGIQRRGAA